jgi:hypothetical protein
MGAMLRKRVRDYGGGCRVIKRRGVFRARGKAESPVALATMASVCLWHKADIMIALKDVCLRG